MIDFSDDNIRKMLHLDSMARIGIFDKYNVCVHEDDENQIPHVYIIDSDTMGIEFYCEVRLDKPEYIGHVRMDSNTQKMFNDFMHKVCRNKHYQNNYEYAVDLWNDNNYDTHLQPNTENGGNVIIPDYSNIP